MFENFYQENAEYMRDNPPQYHQFQPQQSYTFNSTNVENSINNTDSFKDDQLLQFVTANFENIIKLVFQNYRNNYEPTKFLEKFRDIRFLKAFVEAAKTRIGRLVPEQIVQCNVIAYENIRLGIQDEEFNTLLLELSGIVNAGYCQRLEVVGLNKYYAQMLCVARFSSMIHNVIIKRVDFYMIQFPMGVMSKDNIVKILDILFDASAVPNWVKLFPSFMYDALPDEDSGRGKWITSDMELVDSAIELAVLDIINSFPMEGIRAVLVNYAETHSLMGRGKRVRFSMNSLNWEDYGRINEMVEQLRYNEGICVP